MSLAEVMALGRQVADARERRARLAQEERVARALAVLEALEAIEDETSDSEPLAIDYADGDYHATCGSVGVTMASLVGAALALHASLKVAT